MAHTILHHGVFHPLADGAAQPEAMALQDGNIVASGDLAALQAQYPGATLTDLQGGYVFPGFNDAHIHIWKVGSLRSHILDLRGIPSKAALLEALEAFGKTKPSAPWILARGFNEALWESNLLPTREDLDRIFPDTPCQVMRTCAHVTVVNSAALQLAGIDKNTPDPAGGQIGRFQQGEPNGILYERAMHLVAKEIPAFTRSDYREMILEAQELLLEAGITSATDPEVTDIQRHAYQELNEAGLLKVRMNLFPVRLPEDMPAPLTLTGKQGEGMLQINTVKFFADGGLSGRTAALSRPYPGTDTNGILHLSDQTFLERARKCQEAGWKIATHAIGDRAIEQVLQVYTALKQVPNNHLQHRIEHVGLPTPTHLAQIRALGVTVVSQPIFVLELGRNFRLYLDDAFKRLVYPYRQIIDAGIPLAFSSDAPVVRTIYPLTGIRAALERSDASGTPVNPEEAVRIDEALYAYTAGGAQADGHEAFKGKLLPGFKADFVVLSGNPLDVSTSALDEIAIRQVWVNGIRMH